MKTTIITLLSVFSLVKTCNNRNNEYVIWNSHRKLTYADFNGTPSLSSIFQGQTGIKLKLDFKIETTLKSFNVYCLFIKNESWLKIKIPELLEHEQGHFDIGGIYARRLQIELQKVQAQKIPVTYHFLDSMYKKINYDLTNRQNEYNEKTNHFLNVPQQEIWIKAIKEELRGLENKK